VYVLVALVIKHAMPMGHIFTWPTPLYNIFPHYLTKGMIFFVGRCGVGVIEHKMCVLIPSTIQCLKHFSKQSISSLTSTPPKPKNTLCTEMILLAEIQI